MLGNWRQQQKKKLSWQDSVAVPPMLRVNKVLDGVALPMLASIREK